MVFVVKDSPVYLAGAFELSAAMVEGQPKVEAAFRSGGGVAWGESCRLPVLRRRRVLPAGLRQCRRAGVAAGARRHAAPPASGGQGGRCRLRRRFLHPVDGRGFPDSSFVGYDFHAPSIEQANAHARSHGLAGRVSFETAAAKEIAARDFDLITMFDCLHDMGDPRGCATQMRKLLKPDGAWMIVEPIAADHAGDNVANPVSRLYYNASTMICVPTSLAQEVGEALGAQAGEAKLTQVLSGAGFTRVRRAAEGPFNMVLEARP